MPNLARKLRQTASGKEIGPNPCTRSNCYRICKLMAFRSEETALHRCDENATRCRKSIGRCFPSSQIMFGRYQCAHKTLRGAFRSDRITISLIHSSQESKDVEDKLGELVLWLTKLKDSVGTASSDDNPEETERREQLTRFLSHPHHRANSS